MKSTLLLSGAMLLIAATGVAAASSGVTWTLFPAAEKEPEQSGKAAFQNACAICHGAGPDRPGTTSLQFKYGGRLPALLEDRTDLTPDAVKYYIRHGIAMMPSFRKTELSDAQADAIAQYLARKR
jgi:mono/diheme cytochrome c family protein